MEKKEIILLYQDIDIFLNGIKLTKEKKDILTDYNIRRNKLIKYLLLNGHFFQLGIGFFRKVLKLNPSKKLPILKKMSLKEMGICFSTFKLLDKKREIILEISNKNTNDEMLFITVLKMYGDAVLYNQYNVSPEKIKDKIVIDAGSNIGEFAIHCAKLGAKKVYAFEPITETFKILEKQIEINNLKGKVIPIKMALGNKNEIMSIFFNGDRKGEAKIYDDTKNINFKTINHSEQVKVIKLDDFIKKEKIAFIKMDTEGYEENILRGASRIIKKDKPILSFSAYHKPTDKQILPKVVKEIRKDYKIKLLKRAEEDFYCE